MISFGTRGPGAVDSVHQLKSIGIQVVKYQDHIASGPAYSQPFEQNPNVIVDNVIMRQFFFSMV